MSEQRCAVCGKFLEPNEVKIVERQRRSFKRRSRYLCAVCRKREYENYVKFIKKLIKKK